MSKILKFEDYKEKIIEALNKKGVKCSCGHTNFILVESFINQPIQKELTGALIVGGPTLPMIAVVCKNCGMVQFYALKALLPNIDL